MLVSLALHCHPDHRVAQANERKRGFTFWRFRPGRAVALEDHMHVRAVLALAARGASARHGHPSSPCASLLIAM